MGATGLPFPCKTSELSPKRVPPGRLRPAASPIFSCWSGLSVNIRNVITKLQLSLVLSSTKSRHSKTWCGANWL